MKKAEQANFAKLEAEMLKVWDSEKTFQASLSQRAGAKRFRFYDGPPFTSGQPHYGHVEQSALKDAVTRYKTMRGYYVPRRTGIDTHGLPIEYMVEKELGFTGKQDIVEYGIDKFNQACRDIVFRHKADFDHLYHRLGRWTNPDETYATLDDNYIESVWWVFKSLYGKELVYRGYKSTAYCPRCATPLSNFEVNDGYKDNVDDPSLYVKFKLEDEDTFMLAWTTTPWSLPGNAALAVNPDADYVKVRLQGENGAETLILAQNRLEVLDTDYEVIERLRGADLAGKRYEPLFALSGFPSSADLYRVWTAEMVSTDDGTGVLHIAPAFGEDDLNFGQAHGLPVLPTVDANGKMTGGLGLDELTGLFFKSADPVIIKHLTKQGRVFAAGRLEHTYPFCWRCETPLLYYATPSWFVAVSGLRNRLVETGQKTNWVPGHVKSGRFLKWLENARDWAVSRNRFWGAPMPVWECSNQHITVIGSISELKQLSTNPEAVHDLHRPGIDAVTINCSKCKQPAQRIEQVFDCWFESGSMPYGQDHYPFENKEEFDASFPAEFVAEAIEQVHLWFYTLHVLATALFDQPAYKNVVASGLILAADGHKLSKRLRNYPPVEAVLDEYGADVLRFFILDSPLMSAGDTRLSNDALRDTQRNVFMTLWNVYVFFSTYAEIEEWKPASSQLEEPKSDNLLDQWLMAVVNNTTKEVTRQADGYQIARAVRPLAQLVDGLSNWYVRRSRRRFSRNDDRDDRQAAFATLHYALIRVVQLLAPWSPFISDKLYRELTAGMALPPSVHLTDWPAAGRVDRRLLEQMQAARTVVAQGLAQRAEAGIKVRQPLADVTVALERELPDGLLRVVADELNVKKVVQKKAPAIKVTVNTEITQELKLEGVARDIVRQVQNARKQAGLRADDTIVLTLDAEAGGQLQAVIKTQADLIKRETLARELRGGTVGEEIVPVRVEGENLSIEITQAS
ncbi:isoleucine--tRNA ligase [Candidatus Parcubacteria bacterium]|nr:isoleucine--tRNA ligase [Candidatus Parcubacteria bacterium]